MEKWKEGIYRLEFRSIGIKRRRGIESGCASRVLATRSLYCCFMTPNTIYTFCCRVQMYIHLLMIDATLQPLYKLSHALQLN